MWHAERGKGLSCGVDKSCHSCLISMGVDGCVGGCGWMGQSVVEVMSLQAAVAVATCNELQIELLLLRLGHNISIMNIKCEKEGERRNRDREGNRGGRETTFAN